jgi:S-formylglutathione hydrolase FrmB
MSGATARPLLADLSIVGLPILVVLGVVTVTIAAVAIWQRHRLHWWGESIVGLFFVALVVVNVAGWVNQHYDYYPTLDALLGRRAADQASLRALDSTVVPVKGKVVELAIPGTVSGFRARHAQVYVPPAWFERPRPALPVIVLLAGQPGQTSDWTRAGDADVTADAYAREHHGRAPILVMADQNGSFSADTECVNGPAGNVETYLTVDVPAFAEHRFHSATGPQQWAIAGLSEGGSCAVMLSLRHPDVYRTFASYGGLLGPRSGDTNAIGSTVTDLFGGDRAKFAAHEPSVLLRRRPYPELGGWFEVGSANSGPFAAQRILVPLARAAGIDTCDVTIPGGEHTFEVWAQAFRDSLPWMAGRLGITEPISCPRAGK